MRNVLELSTDLFTVINVVADFCSGGWEKSG